MKATSDFPNLAAHVLRALPLVLAVIVFTAWQARAVAQEEQAARKWTDATGKNTVEATLAHLNDDTVELRNTDGELITVKIEDLSKADQDFLKELRRPDPFGPEADEAKTEPAPAAAPRRGRNARMQFHTGRKLELDAPETWQVAPDPAPPWKSALAELKFTLPKGFHHVDVLQAPYSPHAAATFRSGFDLSMRKFDVSQAGFQLGPLIKLPQATPVCLSPGGSRLFMANDRLGASDRSEVAVFDLVAGGAAMRFRWNAFFQKLFLDSFSRDSFELITAVFASDDVLVTIHRNLCAVWDVQAGELRWWTYTESDPGQFWDLGCSGVAVSPGGKQLFFQCDGHLFAVSLADGRVIGKQRSDMVPAQHMTISPDGKSLLLCGQTLRQILIESGKKMVDIALPLARDFNRSSTSSQSAFWVTDSLLMIRSGFGLTLCDLRRKGPVRDYRFSIGSSFGSNLICDGQGGVLYPSIEFNPGKDPLEAGCFRLDLSADVAANNLGTPLPHEVQLGDQLALDLNVNFTALDGQKTSYAAAIRPILERMLQRQGFEINNSSEKRLVVNWDFEFTSKDISNEFPKVDHSNRPSNAGGGKVAGLLGRPMAPSPSLPSASGPNNPPSKAQSTRISGGTAIVVQGQDKVHLSGPNSFRFDPLTAEECIGQMARNVLVPQFVSQPPKNTVELGFGKVSELGAAPAPPSKISPKK